MPYIKQERREPIDAALRKLEEALTSFHTERTLEKGDLNYIISNIVISYCKKHGVSYGTLSDITGVLNDVKIEFERRVVAPYEDTKIKENGDIYSDIQNYRKKQY